MINKEKAETKLHPRSKHHGLYDFESLILVVPQLKQFLITNPSGDLSIPFANPEAVRLLNKALLLSNYQLEFWDLPKGQLCPPIPGRADYIHYLADLLSENKTKSEEKVIILDIGVGANLIYPIIGVSDYHWDFVGADCSENSIKNASEIIAKNPSLKDKVSVRLQPKPENVLQNIILKNDYFDAVMCNPPFFKSQEEAHAQTNRKLKNLGNKTNKLVHNFGGQSNELWCDGGELKFVSTFIKESVLFQNQVDWFTCLISNQDHLKSLQKQLQKVKVKAVKIVTMQQGNKQSRFLAWQF